MNNSSPTIEQLYQQVRGRFGSDVQGEQRAHGFRVCGDNVRCWRMTERQALTDALAMRLPLDFS